MALRGVKHCFEDILVDIRIKRSLVEFIEELFSLFDWHFIESLKYIDENGITLFETDGGRQVFEVRDDSDNKLKADRHYCALDAHYCSCDAFRTGTLELSESLKDKDRGSKESL